MRQMLEHDVDEFYYVTLMNENYPQPSLPSGVEAAIIKGMYRLEGSSEAQVRLLGAGTLLREAQAAARLLADDWQVTSEVFSVTSFSELAVRRGRWTAGIAYTRNRFHAAVTWRTVCRRAHRWWRCPITCGPCRR